MACITSILPRTLHPVTVYTPDGDVGICESSMDMMEMIDTGVETKLVPSAHRTRTQTDCSRPIQQSQSPRNVPIGITHWNLIVTSGISENGSSNINPPVSNLPKITFPMWHLSSTPRTIASPNSQDQMHVKSDVFSSQIPRRPRPRQSRINLIDKTTYSIRKPR